MLFLEAKATSTRTLEINRLRFSGKSLTSNAPITGKRNGIQVASVHNKIIKDMEGVFFQVFCPYNGSYSVIVEDDLKVCYAYLLKEEGIVGDVWLYNVEPAPEIVDWNNQNDMPFLNPLRLIDSEKAISPISMQDELQLEWKMRGDELDTVDIYVRSELIAKLAVGSKPGWSTLVTMDGPLAKRLSK